MFKMMIADDNPYVLEELTEIIDWEDFDIRLVGTYSNGAELLNAVKLQKPDVVLTDISMPVMDGFQLSRALKEVASSARIIFMSSYSEFEYARQAIALHACEYLLKPIEVNELRKVMSHVTEQLRETQRILLEQRSTRQQLEMMRKQAFVGVVSKLFLSVDDEDFIRNRLSSIMINIPLEANLCVACYCLENPLDEKDKTRSYEYFASLISENSEQEVLLLPVIMDARSGALLLVLEDDKICISSFLAAVCVDIESKLGTPISMGYSDTTTQFSHLQKLYMQAQATLEWMLQDESLMPIAGYVDLRPMVPSENSDLLTRCKKISRFLQEQNGGDQNNMLAVLKRSDFHMLASALEKVDATVENVIPSSAANRFFQAKIGDGLLLLFRELDEYLQSSTNEEPKCAVYSESVAQMRSYIHEHYMENITSRDVAHAVFLSTGYANVCFSNECGLTIFGYIVRCRMRRACFLLRETDERISRIAELVGYNEKTSFYLAFKKNMGITPSEYRETALRETTSS